MLMVAARPGGAHPDRQAFGNALRWLESLGLESRSQETGSSLGAVAGPSADAAPDTFFNGWIDNAAELAERLQLPKHVGPAALYRAAVHRWQDDAERHVVGSYAAICVGDDASLRLVRSAWSAPPLSHAAWRDHLIAASLPEAFFRFGMTREINKAAIIDQIALSHDPQGDRSPFAHTHRVPLGTCLELRPTGKKTRSSYGPDAILPVRYSRDEDYLARAEELLGDAARHAAKSASRPGIALSSGLDSPIIAHEVSRHLPEPTRLQSITFRPDAQLDENARSGTVNDEWPAVQRFLAMHPRIDGHTADRNHGGIDHRFREIAQLAGTLNAGLSLFGAHHGVWEKARALGCTHLFGADLGNATFSADGRWAASENFRQMRWARMLALLRHREHDPRPLWRKFLALALLPNLPRRARARLQGFVHPERRDVLGWNTMLSANARADFRRRSRLSGAHPAWEGFAVARDRHEAVQREIDDSRHEMAEITLALELRYGVQYRDVTAYRPLVESCLGLPTEQFVRPGEERWLARRLAVGRMPEAQYREAPHGRHNADWLVRLRRDRERFLRQVEAMRNHAWLAETLDLDRMRDTLLHLPQTAGQDEMAVLPYLQGLGRALVAGQFVGLVEGRNDF